MLAGLDQGSRRLAGAGVQTTVVRQQPGEPGASGPRGRLAIEQGREKSQGVYKFAHWGCGSRIWRWSQEQFQPGDAALGEAGPGNP